jgi:hypothetical protein
MPRKISILQILALQLAHARRIVDEQQGLVAALRVRGNPLLKQTELFEPTLVLLRTLRPMNAN